MAAFFDMRSSPHVTLSDFFELVNLPNEENQKYYPNVVGQFL